MKKPNIIFILCDQMRADFLGTYGCQAAYTPNIDGLAGMGTRFEHAYSAVPSCLPARGILWSGMNQWNTGVLGMGPGQGPVPNDFPHTLPGELTRAGYRTHMVGKGHFEPQRALMGFETTELDESGRMPTSDYRTWFKKNANPNITPDDHGVSWNSWVARPWHTEEHLHPTAWTMSRALDFLNTRDREQPFFLNISFARPHSPYVPPQPYWDLYEGKDLPEPFVGGWADRHEDPRMSTHPNTWRGKKSEEKIRRARQGYLGEMSFIDAQVGRLINWISRHDSEAYKNTCFVFAADHGDMLGDHNLWRKTFAYEGSTRIPLIIVPPGNRGFRDGIDRERSAEQVVELRDIMPTLLDVAGLEIPDDVDGKSVLPIIEKRAVEWREYIHGEHCTLFSEEEEMQYVTNGKRKFIWLPRLNIERFFDLQEDPGEEINLIDQPERQKEIQIWRNYLIQELDQRDCGWVKDGCLNGPSTEPLVSPFKRN
ncbi:MAG: arylsulfatase [Holophagae bacterium]|nr:arylsulfatase [Holophagae bacterium]